MLPPHPLLSLAQQAFRAPRSPRTVELEDARGMDIVERTVTAQDRVRIAFNQYRGSRGQAAVIVCPGFYSSKQTESHRRLGAALSEVCDVLSMDFRGHGRSSGRYTFSAKEGRDLDAVLDWASARYARIALVGFSLGGAVAINAASRRRAQLRAVAAVSAPSEFQWRELGVWIRWGLRCGVRDAFQPGCGCRPGAPFFRKERPVERIRDLADLPVLLVHGTDDGVIRLQHGYRLYDAAPGPKRLELIPGGDHAERLFRQHSERLTRLLQEWLARVLA